MDRSSRSEPDMTSKPNPSSMDQLPGSVAFLALERNTNWSVGL